MQRTNCSSSENKYDRQLSVKFVVRLRVFLSAHREMNPEEVETMLDEGNLGIFTHDVMFTMHILLIICHVINRSFMETDSYRKRENATSLGRHRGTTH